MIYFDNGATSQKPQCVIDEIQHYYESENANIHRGVHHLSQLATEKYEQARETIRQFLGAKRNHEIIFTSGTTAGINLVASSFGKTLKLYSIEIFVDLLNINFFTEHFFSFLNIVH